MIALCLVVDRIARIADSNAPAYNESIDWRSGLLSPMKVGKLISLKIPARKSWLKKG